MVRGEGDRAEGAVEAAVAEGCRNRIVGRVGFERWEKVGLNVYEIGAIGEAFFEESEESGRRKTR